MITEMAQTSGASIFQFDVLPANGKSSPAPGLKNQAANGHLSEPRLKPKPPTANVFMGGFVPPAGTMRALNSGQTNPEHLRQELKEVINLYNISVAVGSSLNLEEVIRILYKESGRLINTSNLAVVIYDDQTSTLNFAFVCDQGKQVKPRSIKLSYHDGLIGRVLTSRMPLLVPDLLAPSSIDTDQLVRSWLGVPILNPDPSQVSAQGVIALWSYEPNAFTEHDVWLLSAISTQAAIAVRNARLHETVLAERDRVIAAEEQARRVLAHELHDGPTQLISAISMRLDFCQQLLKKDPARLAGEIEAAQELAKQTVHQIRTLLFELRPLALETQGLQSAVELFLERRQEDIGECPQLTLKIETSDPDGQIARQGQKVEAALFAIVQETINNALKHAQAKNILVHLKETSTALYLIIADDGNGFDLGQVLNNYEQRGSLGMVNLQERADLIGGELSLESAPGRGTRVIVRVPKAEAERMKKRGKTGPIKLK